MRSSWRNSVMACFENLYVKDKCGKNFLFGDQKKKSAEKACKNVDQTCYGSMLVTSKGLA